MRGARYRSQCAARVVLAAAPAAFADGGFADDWFATSDAAKESQPHWITPVVTVTPRLEQEFRYDQSWQDRPKNVPPRQLGRRQGTRAHSDAQHRVDHRRAGLSGARHAHGPRHRLPRGQRAHRPRGLHQPQDHHHPYLAGGYSLGTGEQGFDIQSTLGIALPTGNLATLGSPVTWNTAFQGHLGKLWPELEVNYVYFKDGPNDGRSQTALTAGLVAGRFELSHRMRFIIGGGYQ